MQPAAVSQPALLSQTRPHAARPAATTCGVGPWASIPHPGGPGCDIASLRAGAGSGRGDGV